MQTINPTPYLNGTAEEELLDQMIDARTALFDAVEKMKAALPHGRDYPSSIHYRNARDEAVRRIAAAQDLADLYYQDAINLNDAGA